MPHSGKCFRHSVALVNGAHPAWVRGPRLLGGSLCFSCLGRVTPFLNHSLQGRRVSLPPDQGAVVEEPVDITPYLDQLVSP